MTARSNTLPLDRANPGAEQTGGRNTSPVRLISIIANKARELWPNKVAVELAARAGVSVRSAENYLAGDRSMNGNALVRLLQSDEGPAFLEAMISDLPPSRQKSWRHQFDKAAERADLRRRLDELENPGFTD
jgi:hypothetical protein